MMFRSARLGKDDKRGKLEVRPDDMMNQGSGEIPWQFDSLNRLCRLYYERLEAGHAQRSASHRALDVPPMPARLTIANGPDALGGQALPLRDHSRAVPKLGASRWPDASAVRGRAPAEQKVRPNCKK
jgi:hypothetical protein